ADFLHIHLQGKMVQAQYGWGATYTPTEICALKGSTVEMQCSYTYPNSGNYHVTRVEQALWFSKEDKEPVDLRSDSEYEGRVEYHGNDLYYSSYKSYSRLRISDLRESDSAVYKFRFITSQPEGRYTGEPGVSLTVTDAPKVPSVLVSPSGEIVEDSSVTLTCSSDANPAATYTWYKENQTLLQLPDGSYHFTSISSEDTGTYHCQSENQYGQNSTSYFIDVQYPPKVPSVSVSPSGEIVEGSSVNLTCSSDANPAANYTWYKNNEASPKALGQTFTITDITSEHSGEYYCEVQNRRGHHRSTLQLNVAHIWMRLFPELSSFYSFSQLLRRNSWNNSPFSQIFIHNSKKSHPMVQTSNFCVPISFYPQTTHTSCQNTDYMSVCYTLEGLIQNTATKMSTIGFIHSISIFSTYTGSSASASATALA
uniref:B-cell receptor CD22 n=1 Tax=Myripristis murdjan TaxID=586833 RepID=A0A667WKD9_9TELE